MKIEVGQIWYDPKTLATYRVIEFIGANGVKVLWYNRFGPETFSKEAMKNDLLLDNITELEKWIFGINGD